MGLKNSMLFSILMVDFKPGNSNHFSGWNITMVILLTSNIEWSSIVDRTWKPWEVESVIVQPDIETSFRLCDIIWWWREILSRVLLDREDVVKGKISSFKLSWHSNWKWTHCWGVSLRATMIKRVLWSNISTDRIHRPTWKYLRHHFRVYPDRTDWLIASYSTSILGTALWQSIWID